MPTNVHLSEYYDNKSRLPAIFTDRNSLIEILSSEILANDHAGKYTIQIEQLRKISAVLKDSAQSDFEDLGPVQEAILQQVVRQHAKIFPSSINSKIAKVYISPSDGGYPILQNDDLPALTAAKRFQHNSGGPALMVFVDAADGTLLATLVVGQSTYHRGNSHYHFEPDEIGEIILSDVMLYRPQVVLLMPNNVTFFKEEFLRQLKNDSGAYIVARFGDPCSYDAEKVRKNLEIARFVDHFIADDCEFADTARHQGLTNVEYIPPFVNSPTPPLQPVDKEYDILFTGAGHVGLKMYDRENMYVRRRNFIQKVDLTFPGSLKVIGKGWGDLNLSNWVDDFISEDEVHYLAQRAKIVIAYDGPYTKGFTSGRTFRTLMSGAFLLIRYFPGIENILVNHRHGVWFHSDEEGLRLIEYYLAHPEDREQIAREGHAYLNEHSGWRRKNIVVDYPLALARGEKHHFGDLFGSYAKPIGLPDNEQVMQFLKDEGLTKDYFNLHDILVLAEKNIALQNYPAARVLLKYILSYDPHFGFAVNDLAVLNILEGNNVEALNQIEQLLSIDPGNEIALDNYQYLQNMMNNLTSVFSDPAEVAVTN